MSTRTKHEAAPSPPAADSRGTLDRLYGLVADEDDVRACRDIPESACREVPGNFFRLLAAAVCTQTGDALVSAKTVLAWLMVTLGAPVAMVAWLVPIRESLSMLPQLAIAGLIRRRPKRKPVWILGALIQAVAVAGMGLVALTLRGAAGGWAVLGCLVVFSLARGLCSVSSKDVLGKTVPKGRRGRLGGLASTAAGLVTIGLGAGALAGLRDVTSAAWFALPLLLAGGLWLVAASFYSGVREEPGETEGGASALKQARRSLSLLKTDVPFRRFVVTRALVLCSALSAPFYIVLARDAGNAGANMLGAFVLAGGLASALSASVWGWFADASSRRVLQWAACLAALLGIAVFLLEWLELPPSRWTWTYPAAFFVLNVAHSGVRVGRKTYLVDLAGGNKRTDYVAVSNTVIGLVLLATGSIGVLAGVLSTAGIILVLSVVGLAGVALAGVLPEAQ